MGFNPGAVGMFYDALLAGTLGGLLWLDRFQVFQIMISRPLVAAPLIGFALGDFAVGLAAGLLYEVLWLERPPVGGYVPPDVTLASVSTAAVAVIVKQTSSAPITAVVFLSFLILLPLAFAGARLDCLVRLGLGGLAQRAEQALSDGDGPPLSRYFAGGLLLGFGCAFGMILVSVLAGAALVDVFIKWFPVPAQRALELGYYSVPLVGAMELLQGFAEKRHFMLFMAGLITALAGGLLAGF
jgi:PTS system mannose-specific IIC component